MPRLASITSQSLVGIGISREVVVNEIYEYASRDARMSETPGGPRNTNFSASATGTIQSFTIPSTGSYRITARGAAGGSNPAYHSGNTGRGAEVSGVFSLTAGTVLNILVGKRGEDTNSGGKNAGAGGGGGSFVYLSPLDTYPLIAAGGGGGSCKPSVGLNASLSTSGTAGSGSSPESGGTNGNAGGNTTDSNYDSGSGAGWLNGSGGATVGNDATMGFAPRNTGKGGLRSTDANDDWGGTGGFGGGGGGTTENGSGGGGGGYSGGGGGGGPGTYGGGGGGGSYISPSATSTSFSVSSSIIWGRVQIEKI